MNRQEYQTALDAALEARAVWLEKNEYPKLKEEFRNFHTAFEAIYTLLIQKKLIHEDPYKQEAKIGEIAVPKAFDNNGDRVDQLTMNLSAYDNQLDFLVNFFQISIDSLSLENIKRILALARYIDWARFNNDTQSAITKALVEVITQARTGSDALTLSVLNKSLDALGRSTALILNFLREATQYNREIYKNELRKKITGSLNAATMEIIKKKFSAVMSGKIFYPDLAEELIREDFDPAGGRFKDAVLAALAIPREKPAAAKKDVDLRKILLEAFPIIGGVSHTLFDMLGRLDENNLVFNEKKEGFFEKLKVIFDKMLNKEPRPVIYEIEYIDSARGVAVKEKVNFAVFRPDLDRHIRSFGSLGSKEGLIRLQTMNEKQLLGILEKAIREAQTLHRTLGGLDEFFRTEASREAREKIKGIRPELAAIKNAIVKANQKRHEYSATLEEEEQLKKLGVTSVS
ncbi:MAG: hypothetical protein LBJ31_01640 [Treponema sp.]|jgi:hypothetical protein|nr:hypothetical protein [Treponema sp.]